MINKRIIPPSELILNPDGSVYHIKLKPENIADNVIVVGDQYRVERVSNFFDDIEFKVQSREFATHTGTYKGKRITVTSTGIGTDNIDIVVNELDAAVNIDLEKRTVKDDLRRLNIIRIGTSGALQEDVPVDSFLISEYGLGMDGLMHHYDTNFTAEEQAIATAFETQTNWGKALPDAYVVKSSEELFNRIKTPEMIAGITATASGFYAPQGRELRLKPIHDGLNDKLTNFTFNNKRITNFEMETSALYGFGRLLNHNCLTVCAIIANRIRKEYSEDYKKTVDELIEVVLNRL